MIKKYRVIWIVKEGLAVYVPATIYYRSNFTASQFDTEAEAQTYAVEQAKMFVDREWFVVELLTKIDAVKVEIFPVTITSMRA